MRQLNLMPVVERAQVWHGRLVWVGATTQRTRVRKAKQQPHGSCPWRNWVRSVLAHKAKLLKENSLYHCESLRMKMSGQLLGLG